MLTKEELQDIFGVKISCLTVKRSVENDFIEEGIGICGLEGKVTWLRGQRTITEYAFRTVEQIEEDRYQFYDIVLCKIDHIGPTYKLTDRSYKHISPWVECYRSEY